MMPNRYREKIREFTRTLPLNKIILVLFDQASQVVGFAILDKKNRETGAIYDLECKKIKDVKPNTRLKDMIDVLIKERSPYIK